MTERRRSTRRRWLATCAGAVSTVPLAGCSDGTAGEDDGDGGGLLGGGDDGDGGSDRLPGWPMYGADPRSTGHHPTTSAPTESVSERWRFDPDTGNWSINAPPAIVDGFAYVGAADGRAWALDLEEQTVLWEADVDRVDQSPLVLDDTVYVQGSTKLHALERSSGDVRWVEDLDFLLLTPIPYDSDVLAVMDANTGRSLYRFDSEDGSAEEVYGFDAENMSEVLARSGEAVYVSHDTVVEAVDVEAGEQVWQWENPVGDPMGYAGTATDGDAVYATSALYSGGNEEPSCYAIDAESGDQLWKHTVDEAHLRAPPAVADGIVYFSDAKTWAVGAENGDLEWTADRGGPVKPTVADGAVFGHDGDAVYALDAASGDELWTFDASSGDLSSPVVLDGVVLGVRAEPSEAVVLESA